MSQFLEQCLLNLRKSDMEYNAFVFGEKIPMSWNKDRMSKRLAEIYEQNIDEFLSIFSMYILLFMKEIHERKLNGKLHAYDNDKDNNILINELCDQLEPWGLIDYNKGNITIPTMLLDLVTKNIKIKESQIVAWQEMELSAQGIIYTYGLLEEDNFFRIVNDCYPSLNYDDIKMFIMRRTRIRAMAIRVPVEEQTWWFADSIIDISSWYWAIQDRKSIPYRKYEKSEYIHTALEGLPKSPNHLDSLIKILFDNGMSEEEAKDFLMDAAIDHCQTLDIKHDLPSFLNHIEWNSTKEFQQFINLFIEFENDTPLWVNKGNTPIELLGNKPRTQVYGHEKDSASNVINFPKKRKIGRNEPCFCGSGKKYKHCCGRINEE